MKYVRLVVCVLGVSISGWQSLIPNRHLSAAPNRCLSAVSRVRKSLSTRRCPSSPLIVVSRTAIGKALSVIGRDLVLSLTVTWLPAVRWSGADRCWREIEFVRFCRSDAATVTLNRRCRTIAFCQPDAVFFLVSCRILNSLRGANCADWDRQCNRVNVTMPQSL